MEEFSRPRVAASEGAVIAMLDRPQNALPPENAERTGPANDAALFQANTGSLERGVVPLQVFRSVAARGGNRAAAALHQRTAVQRRIGFELEDAGKTAMLLKRPLTAKEVERHEKGKREGVDLPQGYMSPSVSMPPPKATRIERGNRFELQTDEGQTHAFEGGVQIPAADLEFVTDPLDETQLDSVRQTAQGIQAVCNKINGWPHGWNNWILPKDAYKGSLILAAPSNWSFKPQFTAEIASQNISSVMQDLGRPVGEGAADAARRDPGRQMLGVPLGVGAQIMGSAPGWAANAIAGLHATVGGTTFAPANAASLTGLVALMVQYIKLGSQTIPSYAKVIAPLMSRHNLVKLFRSIPHAQRDHLRRNGGAPLVALVVAAANQQLGLHGMDTTYAPASMVFRNLRPRVADPGQPGQTMILQVLNDVTIDNWLKGVTTGVDLLTAADYAAWVRGLAGVNPVSHAQAESIDQLESLGRFGKGHRQSDAGGNKGGAFEMRAAGKIVPVDQIEEYMVAVATYFRDMGRHGAATLTPPPPP